VSQSLILKILDYVYRSWGSSEQVSKRAGSVVIVFNVIFCEPGFTQNVF